MVRLVAMVGAVGGVVAVLLPGGAARPDRPDTGVLLGAAALVVVAVLGFLRRTRAVRSTAGLLAAGAAGWAVYCLYRDLTGGLPGSGTAVLAVCAVGVLVALVAAAVRPLGVPVAAGLVVVLAAAAVAGGLLAPRVPLRASTAGVAEPAAMAGQPGERRWTWRTEDPVLGVVAAGAGVVVAVEGGQLAALDGPTGAVRWRYAHQGAHVRALAVTPDRELVLAAFAPGGDRETGAELLVVLDAVTGEVHWKSTVDEWVADQDFLVPTNSVLPVRDLVGENDHTVRALELRTGEELWRWRPPSGCTSPFLLPRSGADVVLTSIHCDDRAGVLALDDRTGERRWSHESTVDSPVDHHLSTNPAGDLVSVDLAGERAVLRTADGTPLSTPDARVDAGLRPLLPDEPDDTLGPRVVDPATGDTRELPVTTCDSPRAHTTTETAYLRICGPDTEASLVWQTIADRRVARTPITWGTPEILSRMLGTDARAVVVPAPGAIVVAKATDTTVSGYPA
ncbi:PQQ-like beta-propeller repeat protein [Actinophytocola gossypii]|uniref:PQQ-binding-like beta-propeller repeat protein n=1 Tax=Actinophytocola gossypii TaxID=2812003 RepID=A0ABT2JDI8_9PSEU|nr:PQQ-like beta-propeller repeat protein [Actinophytocola gossypii]MCT2585505.1 PQQ-binding-like beta-propeller repeat protein [Actinophytocola gossypii]